MTGFVVVKKEITGSVCSACVVPIKLPPPLLDVQCLDSSYHSFPFNCLPRLSTKKVTRHVRGFGNFLFVQFASEPERDSAVARGQNLILSSGDVLLSVQPLTTALGAHLGFEEALQASHRHGTSIGGGVPLSAGGLRHRSSAPGLLSPPPSASDLGGRAYNPNRSMREPSRRHVSICKKVMRAVFGW